MNTIDKYIVEQGMRKRGLKENNIISELEKITSSLSQAIARRDERAFKVNLNSLEALVKELRTTSVFPPG